MTNELPRPRVCAVCLNWPCLCPEMSEDTDEQLADDDSNGVSWAQFVDAVETSKRLFLEIDEIAAELRRELVAQVSR